jgi:hypothetical protein
VKCSGALYQDVQYIGSSIQDLSAVSFHHMAESVSIFVSISQDIAMKLLAVNSLMDIITFVIWKWTLVGTL